MPVPWDKEGLDQVFFYERICVRQWVGGGVTALVVEGDLAAPGAAEEFAALLAKTGGGEERSAVLDMRGTTALPSKVLPVLVSLHTRLARRGGMLALVTPDERLGRLLGLIGMDRVFFITDDPEAAYEAARRASGRWDAPEV